MAEQYTDDQIHRILLEGRFCFRQRELAERWGVSVYRVRQWKKRAPYRHFWRIEDCLVAALWRGARAAPAELIPWLDYCDHALYSEDEVRAMFERLEARGEMRREGERWAYVQVDPPFIFGPRPAEDRAEADEEGGGER